MGNRFHWKQCIFCICKSNTHERSEKWWKHMEFHNSKQILHRIYVQKQWKITHTQTQTHKFIRISLSDKHSIFVFEFLHHIHSHLQIQALHAPSENVCCCIYFLFFCKIERKNPTIYCHAKFSQNYLLVWQCSARFVAAEREKKIK